MTQGFAWFVPVHRPRIGSQMRFLIVAAVKLSAGDIFIWVHAKDKIIGIEVVGEDPGLKSVASITASPASIISRAFGYRSLPNE